MILHFVGRDRIYGQINLIVLGFVKENSPCDWLWLWNIEISIITKTLVAK